jgi:uncharacterized protein YigE (DUF2233 family)
MRRLLFFVVLVALGYSTFWQLQASGDDGWQRLENGLELRTVQRRSGLSTITVTAVRAPSHRVHLAIGSTLYAKEWQRRTKAKAVVNGGYFGEDGRPLGLRIANNKRRNSLRKSDWGVFYIRQGKAAIAHTRDYVGSPHTQEAVQCGPRLVVNGRTTDLKPQWARRTGIGIDRSGRVVLAVSDGELAFDDWAKVWADRAGLNCPNALNLDGGGSTQMVVASKRHPVNVGGLWPVPDALVIN